VVQTIVTGGGQTAVIDDRSEPAGEGALEEVIRRYAREDLDLLVVEGFKREPLPKIEVARAALARELVAGDDPRLIAVVSDFPPGREDVRHFGLDDAAAVADLIAERILASWPARAASTTSR
jgi:molybdopterin-guanine dinucleotide biosynthesis protein MobB